MAFRDPDNPWLLPGIAWALMSGVVGLSYARAHALSGIWILAALVAAGVVIALAFAIIAVSMGLLLVRIAELRERSQTVADEEGPWVDATFESGVIDRCKQGWNTPVGKLSNELLATYLRQKIALAVVMREARRRIAAKFVDDTELHDGELEDALKSAVGASGDCKMRESNSESAVPH